MQENFSQPVALIVPGDQGQINVLSRAGYLVFTEAAALRAYLERLLGLGAEAEAM